jgi:hypothetical protein
MAPADHGRWLVFVYRVPGQSAPLRGTIRRRLTSAGVLFLADAVAALPASPGAERLLRRLRSDIRQAGGSAQLLGGEVIDGRPGLVRAFNAARDAEYAGIIAGCHELLGRIGSAAAVGQFSYAALEEHDQTLRRLSGSLDRTRARDVLDAADAGPAADALARCREAVAGFARRVYELEES